MGTDIDTIFKMLSWNSSEKEQLRGIDEAKKIEYLSVLFQPIEDKSVWENCAKVISSKSDNELKKYMNNMFEWIKDMNWPGAFDIYARIKLNECRLYNGKLHICNKNSTEISRYKLVGLFVWTN